MEETIFPYLSSRLKNISAYKAKDQESNLIYLDKNELSFDILPQDHPELFESLQKIKLNRYPELAGDSLRQRIANKYHIHPGSIMLGNGSDDIINIILSACRPTSRPAWIVNISPSFAMFSHHAASLGFNEYLLDTIESNFEINEDALISVCQKYKPPVLFLATPNNPTGQVIKKQKVIKIVKALPGTLVVIDEAYADYSDQCFVESIFDFPNIAVMRSFSKIGLASLRIGYLLATPSLINELHKVKNPFNVSSASLCMANYFMDNPSDTFNPWIKKTIELRSFMEEELAKIEEIKVYKSKGNFVWLNLTDAPDFYTMGFVVKNFTFKEDNNNSFYRISVGTEEQTEKLVNELKQYYKV